MSYVRGDPWSIPASLILHAFLLLALSSLLAPMILPPATEGIPVEIWSPEEWHAFGKASVPGGSRPDAEEPAGTPFGNPGPIRATTILSATILAHPGSSAMRTALVGMEEETRLEQLCDIEALAQIGASLQQFHPDRIVAYAKSDVTIINDTVVAEGAAFRSHRQWYDLTFKCGLSTHHQAVQSFEFSVGKAIPKRLWDKYNLPDPMLDAD